MFERFHLKVDTSYQMVAYGYSMLRPHGLDPKDAPALLHFAGRQEVVVWRPRAVKGGLG